MAETSILTNVLIPLGIVLWIVSIAALAAMPLLFDGKRRRSPDARDIDRITGEG